MTKSEILNTMKLLDIKEVTTPRQALNGTREFELPIKYTVVREAYNARMKTLRNESKAGLAVGDTVSLTHRKFGGYVKGIVTNVRRTRASVEIGPTVYNIPMEMLTKVGA